MKKQEFIKKLDIYMIKVRKKLINETEKCEELNKIIAQFKEKLREKRKIPVANKLDSQIVSQLHNWLIRSVS